MTIGWNMLYKVCRGLRNFGTERAKLVADITGTSPMIWMEPKDADKRERFLDIIVDELGISKARAKSKKRKK